MSKLVSIGYGNVIAAGRIVAILDPSSAPIKRLKDEAKRLGKLIDATQGRKTRAVIITDSDHIILSGVQVETIAHRINSAFSGIASTEQFDKEACMNLDATSDIKKISGEVI